MLPTNLNVAPDALNDFCCRWRVATLSFFGSTARGTATSDSDLDILVGFLPNADWGLLDHAAMERELEQLMGRRVDLVSQRAIERSPNWIRRRSILDGAIPLYVAR